VFFYIIVTQKMPKDAKSFKKRANFNSRCPLNKKCLIEINLLSNLLFFNLLSGFTCPVSLFNLVLFHRNPFYYIINKPIKLIAQWAFLF